MRKEFVEWLYNEMSHNPDIWVITCDLGYGLWDKIRDEFPERFLNPGASEQAAMGIAVGLAMEGKIPFIYSITPFLLYRPFETIVNYIDHENIPVKLVASGRDKDYKDEGFSHWSEEAKGIIGHLTNIKQYWPSINPLFYKPMKDIVKEMVKNEKPCFISLKK